MSSAVGGRNTRMSPSLVGAITVLVIVVTTFLSYGALRGLPWVPSQTLTVEVPNAANIVPTNEVRVGGTRIGIVDSLSPKRYPNGRVTALLKLKLNQDVEPIPKDTLVQVRARSLLGLKYVQLTPGTSKEIVPNDGHLGLANARLQPVEIDELLNTFDEPTRDATVVTVTEFGNLLGGRGSVIGALLDDARPLSQHLVPVAKVLADDQGGLVPFLTSLTRFTSELAAAGDSTGGLFRGLDRTLGALARADGALDRTLQTAPDALNSTAASLKHTRSLIAPHIAIAQDLQPAFQAAADGAKDLAAASTAGIAGLKDTPRFSHDFTLVLDQLDQTAKNAVVNRGLDGITQFSLSSQPLVEDLSRAQRICGYGSLLFRNIASATFDGDKLGTWLRVVPVLGAYDTNTEAGYATAQPSGTPLPAGAYAEIAPETAANARRDEQSSNAFLYSNPTPVVGQGGVCQPGYETRPDYSNAKPGSQKTTIGNPTLNGGSGTKIAKTKPPTGSPFAAKAKTSKDEQ